MWKQNIQYFDSIDSTNLEAKRQAAQGAPEGTVIMAGSQTAGRGRRGRTWSSPEGGNLYFSVVLRPRVGVHGVSSLTLLMGLSVAEAIGDRVKIKWPNDIVIEGRKVCGILAEMELENGGVSSVIMGVGVNIRAGEFPEEIRPTAISLEEAYGSFYVGEISDAYEKRLLHEILERFKKYYDTFCEEGSFGAFVEAYNLRCANYYKEVAVSEPEGDYRGTALGVNEKGELMVRRMDGTTVNVSAGEVSVRGIYGYV